MPEMPSSVVAISDTAVLISKESTSRRAEADEAEDVEPKNDESQEVMYILNSTNSPEIDDEKQVIEISEDPIE